MEVVALIWIICGIGAAIIASGRHANGCLWFGIGVLLGPIGLALAFASGSDRKCTYCRKGVAADATKCPYCQSDITLRPKLRTPPPVIQNEAGQRVLAPVAEKQKVSPISAIPILIGFACLVAIAVVTEMRHAETQELLHSEPVAVKGPKETGNAAHDRIAEKSGNDQAFLLGQTIGRGCLGIHAFYMGMDSELDAYWSVRCTNGKSYEVQIHPDATGSTKVLSCSTVKALNLKCFSHLGSTAK